MPNKLRSTGIIFATVFALAFVLRLIFMVPETGLIKAVVHPYQFLLAGSITLFLLSAFIPKLNWIQSAVFLISAAIPIMQNAQDVYGLGFFIVGVLLLERAGFFLRQRTIKVIIVVVYLLSIEVVAAFMSEGSIYDVVAPTFFIITFGLFLWFLYKDQLIVFLREPKPRLSLTEKGISPAERTFVLETLKGKSQKEIAVDFDLSESTIRNTLARSYKKLGVEDRVGLAVLGERFEVVE